VVSELALTESVRS